MQFNDIRTVTLTDTEMAVSEMVKALSDTTFDGPEGSIEWMKEYWPVDGNGVVASLLRDRNFVAHLLDLKVECHNPEHDHFTMQGKDGEELPEPILAKCNHCGALIHYDSDIEQHVHSDPETEGCFLIPPRGQDFDGSPCDFRYPSCGASFDTGGSDPFGSECGELPNHSGHHKGACPFGGDGYVEWSGGGSAAGDPLPYTHVAFH